ncbi:flavin-containing amine oxidasedehydrogenase-like protein, partial [Patellaria atrata CBS 101060]
MGRPKKVLVVGAGAAGMSCAHHLAQHQDRFQVTLIESIDRCGGQAFSVPIDKNRYGASWLNQGVQGGSYIFHHTMTMFNRQGHTANPVKLQVSFGKGDQFWTNVYPTKMLARHQSEIKRFYWMLRIVRMFEVFFALLPIKWLVRLFWFSREFANVVALPMVALFLGTGNYAPDVPTIMLERLCTSSTYGMWYPPDKESVSTTIPPMVVFPNFTLFFEDWRKDLVKRGVDVRLSTELTEVVSRNKNGVVVRTMQTNIDNPFDVEERYDELVLCVLADAANRLLRKTSSFRERRVLGSVKFADDITVTHSDANYMRKHYENFYNPDQALSTLGTTDHSSRLKFAEQNFKPMYLIKMYSQDITRLEMCFDCTNYQAQFPPEMPFDDHVFQTIFLNEKDRELWSIGEIDESKVIKKDWWHQLCHSWTHYVFVVPWIWLLQNHSNKHTRFAAAWTLVNAHETAVISGIAAAVDLGAEYPKDLEGDRFAFMVFRLYYLLCYGKWYRRRYANEREQNRWNSGSGWVGGRYMGPGVEEEERAIWRRERNAGMSL